MFSVRDGNINDIKSILRIELLSFEEPWKESDILYEMTESPVAHYLVVEDDNGSIVGFVDYWITFDSATIAQIAIDPSYRRIKLGSLLMDEILKDCYAKRVITVTLEVRTKNESAIGLYHKFGFKDIVVKPHYYKNGDDALYMVKEVEI